ncbi:CIC11C00000003873 [Sungouiella intermedia]|uniref:Elongator complex protein 5 n=1 Tax=Sungouiella intermedia TaxID=45354 RepID=A0A1L0BLR1_9ASCO|nr:CIC11C00000003873 [[Candida] intermedia]
MASQLALVLLNRHLGLRENSPFCLILDSLRQTSHYLIEEFVHCSAAPVIYLSFEALSQPSYASSFLDCSQVSPLQIQKFVQANVVNGQKLLVIVDSLNYIEADQAASFVSSIVLLQVTVVGVYHTGVPTVSRTGYPSTQALLSYIAQAIYELEPVKIEDEEEVDNKLQKFQFSVNENLNQPTFKLTLTNRRKSGKSLTYNYILDTTKHEYGIYKVQEDNEVEEDEEMLKSLTTFNLTTSSKQKLAREQVELPFMEAQTEMGKYGGAIVYEFEKDDDYDEEDPYEDPF